MFSHNQKARDSSTAMNHGVLASNMVTVSFFNQESVPTLLQGSFRGKGTGLLNSSNRAAMKEP